MARMHSMVRVVKGCLVMAGGAGCKMVSDDPEKSLGDGYRVGKKQVRFDADSEAFCLYP
jgi:hypothetical protein